MRDTLRILVSLRTNNWSAGWGPHGQNHPNYNHYFTYNATNQFECFAEHHQFGGTHENPTEAFPGVRHRYNPRLRCVRLGS